VFADPIVSIEAPNEENREMDTNPSDAADIRMLEKRDSLAAELLGPLLWIFTMGSSG